MYNSSHIHVGTLHNETLGILLESRLVRYAPVFGAIAANSPFAHGYSGEFKSYRILHNAHGCTRPPAIRDPRFAQRTWGSDASPKVYSAPTLEVRITDCASSRRLLAELATFTAAVVHTLGEDVSEYQVSENEYREYLINRWMAAKYGLQASFLWNGIERPVVDIVNELFDHAAEGLATLGATRSDLALLHTMVDKRRCQADFVLDLATRYSDPYCLASAHAKLVRDWEVFDNYVASAAPLDPVPVPSDARVREEHLSYIGEGTHFYELSDAMYYPPTLVEQMIGDFIKNELIQADATPRGLLLTRCQGSHAIS